MTGAPEQPELAEAAAIPAVDTIEKTTTTSASPARSDKSSDSEGKPVREQLKETRLDSRASANADQNMKDAPNGTTKPRDESTSGSDSERGRLRRKRSREDFEDENDSGKPSGKKPDTERHARKKSRDITKDDLPQKPAPSTIPRIEETDGDEQMTSPNKNTSTTTASDKAPETDASPKNKRTRDQVDKDANLSTDGPEHIATNGKVQEKAGDERDTKRLRDKADAQPATEAPPLSRSKA